MPDHTTNTIIYFFAKLFLSCITSVTIRCRIFPFFKYYILKPSRLISPSTTDDIFLLNKKRRFLQKRLSMMVTE